MPYRSQRLAADHDLGTFTTGEATLDTWLRNSAANADRMGTARTFVWADDQRRVVGYFSLCPHEIRRDALATKIGRGSPDTIPSILLARLTLDRDLHGQGLGAQLLVDAIGRAVDATRVAGGRFIVIDALHATAVAFYAHHGFAQTSNNPLRLVMKASDAATSLGRNAPPDHPLARSQTGPSTADSA